MAKHPKTELKKVYRAYANEHKSDEARISLLIKAVGLIDALCRMAVVQKVVPPETPQLWEKARKCRERAMGTTFNGEKETALRMFIRLSEKIVEKLVPPMFAEFSTKLDSKLNGYAAAAVVTASSRARQVNLGAFVNFGASLKWRKGSSAEICASILMANDSISISQAVTQLNSTAAKSTNPKCRVLTLAHCLIKAGLLRKSGDTFYRIGGVS